MKLNVARDQVMEEDQLIKPLSFLFLFFIVVQFPHINDL